MFRKGLGIKVDGFAGIGEESQASELIHVARNNHARRANVLSKYLVGERRNRDTPVSLVRAESWRMRSERTPDELRLSAMRGFLGLLGVPKVHNSVKFGNCCTQSPSLLLGARLRRHSEQLPQRVQRWLWLLLLPSRALGP